MPLVVVSGLPCSGKTRRVAELVEYIQSQHSDREVQVRTCKLSGIDYVHDRAMCRWYGMSTAVQCPRTRPTRPPGKRK